ncbi:23S rRNA (pseudouridine(1915)-N(3))-methyltransferase RlmH [Magnetococcus sp. PR-3]|uniref:23S rRNA (pseudouridine(1915)-N(3))-methyltransferase RlmH n=1 Tax=Magnetococcus sp. PR-3 TaxID=3120355 RepID=UPI002FCE4B90
MSRFRILSVGRGMPKLEKGLFDDYASRMKRYGGLELLEIAEGRRVGKESDATRKKAKADEAARMAEKMDKRLWIALDRGGKPLDSEGLAKQIQTWHEAGDRDVGLLIGGPDGLDASLLQKCRFKLAFGPMTFPHMLVRVMVAEQLYRAMTIQHGVPYHR